jgi:hypothetical protein
MPANQNVFVPELLSWHGHDAGGVRVPFGAFGNPLGRVIPTSLVAKLTETARLIAEGRSCPRWILLLGGPGNGKSQMVETFVQELDGHLGCNGALVLAVAENLNQSPIPRRVEVSASTYAGLGEAFRERVGELIVVQDASASDAADGDAAEQLAGDLSGLISDQHAAGSRMPVFVCCANRGLLARAMNAALGTAPDVVDMLEVVIRSSGLGDAALQAEPPRCWPIRLPAIEERRPELAGMVACWPLDVESLLLGYQSTVTPLEEILQEAVGDSRWEQAGCSDCSSRKYCPFYTNATWLREEPARKNLLTLLRRAELATGERWNFRAMFSLAAELVVGERDDFRGDGESPSHPCAWVHKEVEDLSKGDVLAATASLSMSWRLFPHALFVGALVPPASDGNELSIGEPVTRALVEWAQSYAPPMGNAIRRRLRDAVVAAIDPAGWSPEQEDSVLAILEDTYSQSVALGNTAWPAAAEPASVEAKALEFIKLAEDECDPLLVGRDSAKAFLLVRFLRQLGATLAKRSVGVRSGGHGNERYLSGYEAIIRDRDGLSGLQSLVRSLLSGDRFRFNALASFGQPHSEAEALVVLETDSMPIQPISPAPSPSSDLPAHDLPSILIGGHRIPLTFDLFMALQLRRDHCAAGSLPASVRASLDRIRHLYAGEACRDVDQFLQRGGHFRIDECGDVVLTGAGDPPRFVARHANR